MDRQAEAFRKAQSAAVNEFERNTVAAQADVEQELANLLARQHGGQFVVILGLDLREDLPILVPEHLDEEDLGRGGGLPDRLGLPPLDVLDVEDVVAQLRLRNQGGILARMLLDQAQVAVVGMPGPIAIVPQVEQLGELGHRGEGMGVVHRIAMDTSSFGTAGREDLVEDGNLCFCMAPPRC